jgi:hypothetical protein
LKRGEVIRRCREGRIGGEWWSASGGLLVNLTEDSLLALATALGIEVEPDEEPLPERLVLSARDEYGPPSPERSRRDFNGNEGHILVFSRAGNARRLLDALISAYNERPRWRTGVPDEDGWYLVATQYGASRDCARWGMGSWWRIEGELRFPATVAHWMPLPAAPK